LIISLSFLNISAESIDHSKCILVNKTAKCEVVGRKLGFADRNNIPYKVYKLFFDKNVIGSNDSLDNSKIGYSFEFPKLSK
jgi:hypothetical protein